MHRHAGTNVLCRLVVLSSLLLVVVHAANGASETDVHVGSENDYVRSRQRRSCSEPYTMSGFIDLVRKIEGNDTSTTTRMVAAYLRELAYNSYAWHKSCGTPEELTTGLTNAETNLLNSMVGHHSSSSTGLEVGVILTQKETVAIGHVMAGIDCGGFNRDTHVQSDEEEGVKEDMDNMFQSTISGDIGQTTLLHYAYPTKFVLLGPSGKWDSASCPKVYTLNSKPSSELTDAELLGDIDGVILGTIIPMIKKKPLSQILYEYYQGSGVDAGGRIFKAADRNATFGELLPDHELEAQSMTFSDLFYYSKIVGKLKKLEWPSVYSGKSKAYLLKQVPSTVQTIYKNLYETCPNVLKTKYTINYFVNLVKQLERETKYGIADMTRAIVTASKYSLPDSVRKVMHRKKVDYTYTSGFSWYVIREMLLHRFVDRDSKRELGVIDAGEDTVAVGPVLAGLAVGANYKTEPSGSMTEVALTALHAVTVTGILASAADSRSWEWSTPKEIMGLTGVWVKSSCPPKYRLKKIMADKQTTRAELLGGIDGLVLGERVSRWLAADPRLKLSDVLERYYGVGYQSVSSQRRLDQFKTTIVNKDKFIQRVKHACSSWYCRRTAEEVAKTFYRIMLPSSDNTKTSSGSRFLPSYRTLVAAYPGDKAEGGDISGVDLRKKVTGNLQLENTKTLAAIDGLRLSYMLNQLDGHHIPKDNSQGAFIGRDKKVYIYDLAALKTYLTKTYGDPLTVSSVSEVTEQSGILMLDVSQTDRSTGSVGLWDGKNMHQIKDYTKASSVRSVTLWKTNGCASHAEVGNCEFYKCVDSSVPCRNEGYALGYGFRYCSKFTKHYDKFTADGKAWVDEVRKCLMKAIAPFYKGAHDCDTIKRIAFDSHVDCYIKSGVGFCKMAADASNWDALWAVYEMKDFAGPDSAAAWKQVLDTSNYCIKDSTKSVLDVLRETVKDGYKKLQRTLEGADATNAKTDVSSQCVAYANAGDCRFYRCFHERFPCDVFGASHVTDFELLLCVDLEMQSQYFDSQGRQWMKATNKCLMQKLLPLYKQTSISCIDLHGVLFRDRVDCLVDSGFCGVTDSTHNRWAIDRGTDLESYPALLPDRDSLSTAGREYFFSELSSFRRIMGYANYACYAKGLKRHQSFYARVRTDSGYRLVEQN